MCDVYNYNIFELFVILYLSKDSNKQQSDKQVIVI